MRQPAAFNAAKQYVVIGVGLGFLLWFTGFMVVGGEWFLMWQSKQWNGQERGLPLLHDAAGRRHLRQPAGRRRHVSLMLPFWMMLPNILLSSVMRLRKSGAFR